MSSLTLLVKHPSEGETKVCLNGLGHMTKWRTYIGF